MTAHLRSDCDLCRRYDPDPPPHIIPHRGWRSQDETIGLTIDELLSDEPRKEDE